MTLIHTDRLAIRKLEYEDSGFIIRLLNDPAWLKNIGDKQVHSLADARQFLESSIFPMYENYGFGLLLVELKETSVPIGICGLIKRETLEHVDLGFAFLAKYRGQGFALECASATIDNGRAVHGLKKLAAIVLQTNVPCIKLLQKAGFRFKKKVRFKPREAELLLFVKAT